MNGRAVLSLFGLAGLLLTANVANASENEIAGTFLQTLSSGDLRTLVSIVQDSRQLRERDFIAVATALDQFHCIDARSIRVEQSGKSATYTDYRVDLDSSPAPGTWYIRTATASSKIVSIDDEAFATAKRFLAATTEDEREGILTAATVPLKDILAALSRIPFYDAVERERAERAFNTMLLEAERRNVRAGVAELLSAYARLRANDGQAADAESLALRAIHVAESDDERAAARLVWGTILLNLRERKRGTCVLDDLSHSAGPEIAHRAIAEIANPEDERYNFDLDESARLSWNALKYAESTDSSEIAFRACLNLGLLYRVLHADDASIDELSQARSIARERADAAAEAFALLWLANERERMPFPGAYQAADTIPELREALALVPPQRKDLRAYVLGYLGFQLVNHAKLDDDARALTDAEAIVPACLSIVKEAENPLARSVVFFFLEQLRMFQHRNEEALDYALRSASEGENWPLWRLWVTETHIATILRALGRTEEALPHYERSLSLIEARKALIPTSIEGTFRYLSDKSYPYQAYADALGEVGRPADALKIHERLRSILLATTMTGNADRVSAVVRDRVRDLEKRLARLNRHRFSRDVTDSVATNDRERSQLEMEIDRLESEILLQEKDPSLSDSWKSILEPVGVLSDNHTVVVAYDVSMSHVVMFVIRGDGNGVVVKRKVVAASVSALANLVEKFRAKVTQKSLTYENERAKLYELLIRPIEEDLQEVSTLYIIPDAWLWRVPFSILGDRSDHLIIDRFAVAYAASLAALREGSELGRSRRHTDGELLAFGNPVIGRSTAASLQSHYRGLRLGDLPEAEEEVRSLKSIYGSDANVLIGRSATESAAKHLAPSYRILHFASHGFNDPSRAMYSALLLSPSAGSDSPDDGVFEAREIAKLHLNADLAVLSACDTADGNIYNYEGIVGLAWAFLAAGCPTTVASQWNTESSSTAALMIQFHTELRNGSSKPEALRRAMQILRSNARYRHPFYWAPFIVIGAP